MKKIMVVSLLGVILAGCTGDSPHSLESSSTTWSATNSTTMESHPVPQLNVTQPSGFELNGCEGIFATNYVEANYVDAQPPIGWGPASSPIVSVTLEAQVCDRIATGPFERGPISIVYEFHRNGEVPPKCQATG